jgi:hypothetical protein
MTKGRVWTAAAREPRDQNLRAAVKEAVGCRDEQLAVRLAHRPKRAQTHPKGRCASGASRARTSPARQRRYLPTMVSADLSRRVEEVVDYPPLCEMGESQRRELHDALLDADVFEDLPGKWQAAIVEAEGNRSELRVVGDWRVQRNG